MNNLIVSNYDSPTYQMFLALFLFCCSWSFNTNGFKQAHHGFISFIQKCTRGEILWKSKKHGCHYISNNKIITKKRQTQCHLTYSYPVASQSGSTYNENVCKVMSYCDIHHYIKSRIFGLQ